MPPQDDSLSQNQNEENNEDQPKSWSIPNIIDSILPPPKNSGISAQDVPKGKRLAQILVAILYNLLAAGIIFGFAALKPVLIQEHVYRKLCTPQEILDEVDVCYKQELRLNLMFIIAAVATNIGALIVGTIMDRYGPRIPSVMGCAFLVIGSLFMAFSSDRFDGYIAGYLFLALGGPFVFITSFQLSNAFPRFSGSILAVLTGAFDASTAIPLFYRLIYQETGFKPKKFFLSYLIIPVLILIAQIFLMPGESYKILGSGDNTPTQGHTRNGSISHHEHTEQTTDVRPRSESTALLDSIEDVKASKVKEEKLAISGVYGALHGYTAWQQMLTPWFILMSLFTILQMLRVNYFCATIRSQYKFLLSNKIKATQMGEFFDIALPAGGVVAAPFIGTMLDNTSTTFALSLLVGLATAIGILGVLPFMGTGYANIILFVLYRPLLYTTVSDYAAKVFGFDTFGKVWGMIIFVTGLFNFFQSAFDRTTHERFDDDPVPINVLLLVLVFVIGSALVGFVWWSSRKMRREGLKGKMNGETDRLVGVENGEARNGGREGYGTNSNR